MIERFSEDIDLSLAPAFLQLREEDLEQARSRTQHDKIMRKLERLCTDAVREQVQPELERRMTGILGRRDQGESWLEFTVDEKTHSPVLSFHYPTRQADGFAYLRRAVKLEFGSLTDQRPTGRHPVTPWIRDQFPFLFQNWQCEVVALEVERSFWEKATILHMEYHRPADRKTPARYSRHYYDLAALGRRADTRRSVSRMDLCERVVDWKSRFFASTWAQYDLAKCGSFRLVPPEPRQQALAADYDAMRDMFLQAPPTFDRILAELKELEDEINSFSSRESDTRQNRDD